MSVRAKHLYEFGPFHLDAAERVLTCDGQPVGLTPKAFDTLLALVERSGHIVEKDELMRLVWPDSFVEESNLSFNISVLRRTLAEAGGDLQFIETVPRRGYRFSASVRETRDESSEMVVEKQTLSHIIIEEVKEERETENLREPVALSRVASPTAVTADVSISERLRQRWKLLAASVVLIAIAAVVYLWVASAPRQNTIAVLPFKPLSADDGDKYLELGMADALITKLSNINQLIVRPTNAILKYADSSQDPVAVGRELGVESVLDGSVQRAGDRVRITVRLMRVSDGASLWAGTFDESFTNIFAVQDSISERMADALALKITGEERKLLKKRYTENIEAYQAYLKGRFYWSKWTSQSLRKAIEQFEEALKIDANYALAYAGLCDSYSLLGYIGGLLPVEAYPKGKEAALKALEIDSTLGEAYIALAHSKLFYDWNWAGSEADIKRGLELSPNYGAGYGFYGAYLTALGRFDEALQARKRAQELDPLSPFTNLGVGWVHYYAHRWDQAIEHYRKALELDPNFITAHSDLGNALSERGMHTEAVDEYLKAKALGGEKPEVLDALKQAYATSGIKGYWQKELEMANERLKQGRVRPFRMARIYIGIGDKDQALEWLEKAFEERDSLMVFVKVSPLFDSFRADPRFASLIERIGFKP